MSKQNVNMKHIMAYLQDNYTTVSVVFASHAPDGALTPLDAKTIDHNLIQRAKTYTYKVLLEDNIKVGDVCIVNVSGSLKIVQVLEIHTTPKIDPSAQYPYKWIVQKINTERYEKQVQMESKVQDMFFEIEAEQQRTSFKENIKAKLEGNEKAMSLFNEAMALINSSNKAITNGN